MLERLPEPNFVIDKQTRDYIFSLIRVLRLNEERLDITDGTFLPIGSTTDDIPEGIINLYFTDIRAQNAARADFTNSFLLMGG